MNPQTLISPDRLNVIKHLCKLVEHVPGNAIEVGVYRGGSLSVIAHAIPHKMVYGFDTFEGLPASKSSDKEVHQAGDFSDTSLEAVEAALGRSEAYNTTLVKGLFPECVSSHGIDTICFAHLDVDFGKSMTECLEYIWGDLSVGGVIVVDDYNWPKCPEVKPAVDTFISDFLKRFVSSNLGNFEFYTPAKYQFWIKKT